VSHENQEGSKAVSIERSSFKDVSEGSFLYFQSGFFFKPAQNYSATYNGKNWLLFLKLALYIGFLPPGTSMPCMLMQYMPAHCTAMSCMATTCKPRHSRPHQARPRHARLCSALIDWLKTSFISFLRRYIIGFTLFSHLRDNHIKHSMQCIECFM
jgi:hypothetical protein